MASLQICGSYFPSIAYVRVCPSYASSDYLPCRTCYCIASRSCLSCHCGQRCVLQRLLGNETAYCNVRSREHVDPQGCVCAHDDLVLISSPIVFRIRDSQLGYIHSPGALLPQPKQLPLDIAGRGVALEVGMMCVYARPLVVLCDRRHCTGLGGWLAGLPML